MSQTAPLLFYINSLHRGGAQRVLLQLAGRFADLAGGLVYLDSVIAEFRQNDLQKKHSDLH